jgi:hypothetical protein
MRNFIIGLVAMCSLYAQGLKVITQQISLSQEPMLSDSLVLKGSLGKNFHRSGSGETFISSLVVVKRSLFFQWKH